MNDGTPTWGSFMKCYTEHNQGYVGWGYLVQDGAMAHQGSGGLGEWSSVFQAEITAITRVAQLLTYHKSIKIVSFADSQAALVALDNTKIHLYLV